MWKNGEWWFEWECSRTYVDWFLALLQISCVTGHCVIVCIPFFLFLLISLTETLKKPNTLISWRTFVMCSGKWCKIVSALIADVVMSWVFTSLKGKELQLWEMEEPVKTIFHPSSKQKPHLVFRGQNIHVKSKGHALHFETEHGHKSESCRSQMNILAAK